MPTLKVQYPKISRNFPLISEQMSIDRLEIILGYLSNVIERDIIGDIVEMGCFIGTTSLFLQRLLVLNNMSDIHRLHVYDSFEGLPDKSYHDASIAGTDFRAGELKASKKDLIRNFKRAQLPKPIIHKKWFNQLSNKEIPKHIAFAFLDGDFYNSILACLNLIWQNLSEGAVVIVDDYNRSNLPGVNRAIEEFNKTHNFKCMPKANLAIITR